MRTTTILNLGDFIGYWTLLKLYMPEFGRWVGKRTRNGVTEIIDWDFRMAIPDKRHTAPRRPNIHTNQENTLSEAYVDKFHVSVYLGAKSAKTERVYLQDYVGPYPKYIYVAPDETETPEDLTHAIVPSWVETETPEERATRERKENIADWNRTAHYLAKHVHNQANIFNLANEYGQRKIKAPVPTGDTSGFTPEQIAANLAGSYAFAYRIKLIGMLWRLVKLYEDHNDAIPFDLHRDTEWAVNRDYLAGDYEKHGEFTYTCNTAHTSADTNRPDVDDTTWSKVFLNRIPGTFNFDAIRRERYLDESDSQYKIRTIIKPTKVKINLATGEGILDYIRCVSQEFGYHSDFDPFETHPPDEEDNNLHAFYGFHRELAKWTTVINEYELHTSKVSHDNAMGLIPSVKIYDATVAPTEPSRHTQVRDAQDHTNKDWAQLYEHYFDALEHHVPRPDAQSPFLRSPG